MVDGGHPCGDCFWSDDCPEEAKCDHYDPIEPDEDEIIEKNRERFFGEWFEYMEEQNG